MRTLLVGVVIGVFFGATGTALAARVVGDQGFLLGWDVKVGSEVVCRDPYVWPTLQEIDCD